MSILWSHGGDILFVIVSSLFMCVYVLTKSTYCNTTNTTFVVSMRYIPKVDASEFDKDIELMSHRHW